MGDVSEGSSIAKVFHIQGCRVTLNIEEQSEQFRVHPCWKLDNEAQGLVLVFDVTDKNSFRLLTEFIQVHTREFHSFIPTVLVGHKADLKSQRKVWMIQGEELADQYGFEYFETSQTKPASIEVVFAELAAMLLEKVKPKPFNFKLQVQTS